MELAKEDDYRFCVRIASKIGLTCIRIGHSSFLPQSELHSEAFGYLCASVCQAEQVWLRSQAFSHHFWKVTAPPTLNVARCDWWLFIRSYFHFPLLQKEIHKASGLPKEKQKNISLIVQRLMLERCTAQVVCPTVCSQACGYMQALDSSRQITIRFICIMLTQTQVLSTGACCAEIVSLSNGCSCDNSM